MTQSLVQRVNPRVLLGTRATEITAAKSNGAVARIVCVTLAGVIGLAAFGTMVVRANDDAGVLSFVRQNVRAPAAPTYYRQAPQAYPVAYYAPKGFFQRADQPSRRVAGPPKRQQVIIAAYAPFGAYVPTSDLNDVRQPKRSAAGRRSNSQPVKLALPAPSRAIMATGGRIAYCVRTCDGFFFPLGMSTGSEKGDEAACNSFCPAAETRLFVGAIGTDIDEARARDNGRKYATLTNAFSYRKSVDAACSCTRNGFGLANNVTINRDASLRRGDIVMTKTGMKVFDGGSFPYRDANFTNIGRSNKLTAKARSDLRAVEQASLPGKSGITALTTRKNATDELKELAKARLSAETASQIVRYVGPDRSTVR